MGGKHKCFHKTDLLWIVIMMGFRCQLFSTTPDNVSVTLWTRSSIVAHHIVVTYVMLRVLRMRPRWYKSKNGENELQIVSCFTDCLFCFCISASSIINEKSLKWLLRQDMWTTIWIFCIQNVECICLAYCSVWMIRRTFRNCALMLHLEQFVSL